jgi:hypothetical protein
MKGNYSKYRDLTAQGWILMFIIFLAMFVVDLTHSAILQDFTKWQKDPGSAGLSILIIIMAIYALMPMLIKSIQAKWFRRTVIGVTVFFTLFFVAHQITHLLAGDKPFGVMHVLDFSHHVLGVWVIVVATLWLKEDAQKST